MDLRKLRYFLAVADQLNFTRAAAELHIAQPVLSRQIRALEGELNAQLFVRDRRRTELTPAGQELVAEATALLAGAQALRRRVAQATRGDRCFVVGFMPGLTVSEPVRALRAAHPDLNVEVLRTGWTDQVTVLHDGRVDVGFVRLPVDARGLQLQALASEPRAAILPSDHPLADNPALELAELTGEHLLQPPDVVPEWRTVGTQAQRSGPAGLDRGSHTVEEKLEHVAQGRGVVVLPLSAATYYQRSDVVAIEIVDLAPSEISLAWRAVRRSPLIAEFVALATADALVPA